MTGSNAVRVALAGGGVIAVTYGLARFILGLFLPEMRDDLGLSPQMAGLIGACPFASYVVAILSAPSVARILGVGWATGVAGGLAAAGLALVGRADGPVTLALGVIVCGLSTGLSSPVLAAAVRDRVPAPMQGRVNATINAATSVGIVAAAPAVLGWSGAWREAYTVFALIAAATTVLALAGMPRRAPEPAGAAIIPAAPPPPISREQALATLRMSALAGTMGFVSAVYWVFAPDLVVHGGGLPAGATAWMWAAVGIGGLSGIAAGDLIDRHGVSASHAFTLAVLAASLALLAAAPESAWLTLVSAATFGAAYMTLTGIHLVLSTRLMPERPAVGPVLPFLAIAAGQIAGSPVGGWLIAKQSHGEAFGAFAALGMAVAVAALWIGDGRKTPAPAAGGAEAGYAAGPD